MMDWELSQYVKRVLRWWWLFVLSAGIAAGASYYASMQQPRIYQTATTLMVGQVIQKANPTGNDFATIANLAQSYAQMASRQPILQATIDGLALEMEWQALKNQVNAASIPGTQLLAINVQDTSPERAVAIADEIAYQLILQSPTSPENRQRQERGSFVQSQLDDLEMRIDTAKIRVEELRAELDTALSARQIQQIQTEITSLEGLINNWQANYSNLLSFLDGGDSPNYLTVIEPAQYPWSPVSPKPMTNVVLAAAVGLALALGAALLLEYLDDTLKSAEEIDALGLTALGSITKIKGDDYSNKLITAQGLASSVSEAYRLLRTNLQFVNVDNPAKSIVITSSMPGEGKSLTAANLSIIMSQANLKTILIDADLRRPTVHKIFKVSNSIGLTDLLCNSDLELVTTLKNSGIENLQIMTSGPIPPNPAELLGSQRMEDLLDELHKSADIVIFDSPPILVVTDSTVLANKTDGAVMVTLAKQTRRRSIKDAIDRLDGVDANILGAILNRVPIHGNYYYKYSSYYTHSGSKLKFEVKQGKVSWWRKLLPNVKS